MLSSKDDAPLATAEVSLDESPQQDITLENGRLSKISDRITAFLDRKTYDSSHRNLIKYSFKPTDQPTVTTAH
jgi:hypothetical protein